MTASAELATVSPLHPTVVAEFPRRSSRRLRATHAVLHATLRKACDAAVWADDRKVLSPKVGLAITTRVDRLLLPLRPRRGTRLRMVEFPKFRAEWVWDCSVVDPDVEQHAAIIYFHGGGLFACGLNSHRRMVARIARTCGIPLLNVDYRQIPEAHVTETVDDCVEAYRYLLDNGFAAERIIVMGDSAGGGLSFSLAMAARDRGLPMPAAIVGLSPWANYDSALRKTHPNNPIDALISADGYAVPAKWGIAIDAGLDPAWSPVNGNFAGLPPTLIHVSSTEVLLSDAELLAARYAEYGIPLTLQIWDNAFHVFQIAADLIPDARDSIGEIATFVGRTLDAEQTSRPSIWSVKTTA
ncbi:alpha/beta hydrolase [Antrihabitans sp. YC3-6]|uniref:Alpha/beta hydrolase n=1 Tax=Antrihabitans stalagmiti TaxID=2799499 RepID=A0A934U615_9NOCA|nr:alpha/beta hydrolase [Antrihabitans stalagmiti]MBJ8342031.1 alpha/beta hydrolase [Antrihabitans stalagmiti]